MKDPDPQKIIRLPVFNPRILTGARISESTIDELSFTLGLSYGSD